ncbi:GNAT family N-acetyltransferase [Microbulbifer elongatus]|uniref:GNAT family N-acetyltransferase n=2 Tax=Microbulbifer elongatus TaxID=86173 RepID=A0ABT1NZ57_9GAMM|nr:GNAT family N-acetyltransferase [Microbulbifer elongatus]
MEYQVYQVEESEKDSLAHLRIAAMRESLTAIDRFDPVRARKRFLDSFDIKATRKIEINGRLVGFYVVKNKKDHCHLEHLYIHPEYQGNKVGSSILQSIISVAQENSVALRLGALRGSRANEFYLSHGFVKVGESEWDIYYEYRDG